MILNPCIEVQTSPVDRPSVPEWFAEVVIMVHHLTNEGILDAFAHQIRLVRGRFGTYEPIDFLALLVGYALSGERTLADFFERVTPFETAFMALFGRQCLPHRSSLSRFLAAVDHPCLEAFRALFQQKSFAQGWTSESIGGIFDRQGRRYIVFDVDATRQAARQRALPCDSELPPARRRLDAVCAPGYQGRKRGEVVRTRTTTLQMRTRQWIGTYAGRGNGDYRSELASALHAITTYLGQFAFPSQMALVRLDGQYGDAAVMAQIMLAGVFFVTRGRGYQLLERPQIQQVLTHPAGACVTRTNTGEIIEVFDGGWLHLDLDESLPQARVIITRHLAPPDTLVKVGKRVEKWVYELFLTTLDADGFLAEDIVDLYHGRGAFEAVLAEEDVENDADRWCSYTECGQELWQIACQWVWNLRLIGGHEMQGKELREMEWSGPKALPPLFSPSQALSETYGPWKWAKDAGRPHGRFRASDFPVQENGTLRCPTGASLWLNGLRQESLYTQRATYAASLNNCRGCLLRERCLTRGASGNRARRVSVIRRLLPAPSSVEPQIGVLGAMRWVDVAGRALRRAWITHWRRQYVEVIPLAEIPEQTSPPPRPPRAKRSHHRWSWQNRLAWNAWWGPPQQRITIAGVPAFLTLQ